MRTTTFSSLVRLSIIGSLVALLVGCATLSRRGSSGDLSWEGEVTDHCLTAVKQWCFSASGRWNTRDRTKSIEGEFPEGIALGEFVWRSQATGAVLQRGSFARWPGVTTGFAPPHGVWTRYFEESPMIKHKIMMEGRYEYGRRVGIWRVYKPFPFKPGDSLVLKETDYDKNPKAQVLAPKSDKHGGIACGGDRDKLPAQYRDLIGFYWPVVPDPSNTKVELLSCALP